MPPYNRKHYRQRRQATVIDNVGGLASKRYDCSEGNGFTQKIVKRRVKGGKKQEIHHREQRVQRGKEAWTLALTMRV
jgi:hypothetical protein